MNERIRKKVTKRVDDYLKEKADKETILLYDISVIADEAAREAGRKSELHGSLFDYEDILPPGAKCAWANGFYVVLNPNYRGERKATIQKPPLPGVFDAAVDLGPEGNKEIYDVR